MVRGMRRPSLVRPLTITYAVVAAADTVLAGSGDPRAHRARLVTKPLLMPVLAAAFAVDPRGRRSPLGRPTRVAQLAGWIGDLALLRSGTSAFLTGMGAFAAGQASYLSGFRRHRAARVWRTPIGGATALAFAATGPVLAVGAAQQDPVLGPGVLTYAALVTAMAAHAGNLAPSVPIAARRATAAGGLAFLASDTLLGIGQFALTDPPAWLECAVMATYATAQYLLAEGALRAAPQSAE